MDRRAFLRLTLRGREPVLELSCERLHVRWVDAQAGTAALVGAGVADVHPSWEGEPPLDVVSPTTAQLVADLERCLAEVDVTRLTGREWLAGNDLGREVERVLAAFRLRGGRVE